MSKWQTMDTAPKHWRSATGSTEQPHVIGTDGLRVGEARCYDGTWYWMDTSGEEANLVRWQPLPDLPDDLLDAKEPAAA